MRVPLQNELEPIVTAAYDEGRVRYGDLGLAFPVYRSRIDSIVHKHLGPSPARERMINFVKVLHGRDLYLATACAQCSPGAQEEAAPASSPDGICVAWKTLEATYKGLICDLVRYFHRTSFAAQDLADNMIADLYLPDRSGHSRIASYDGRSSLGTWLRVVICNRAINAQRRNASFRNTDLQQELPDEPAWANIELTVLARRYAAALQDAVSAACGELTPRERLMLLWRYQDGLQLGQIAQLLGIHQSNVTRQLERMQGKLRDDVTEILSTKHGLSKSAVQECLKDVIGNPRCHVSILDCVKGMQDSGHKNCLALLRTSKRAPRKHSTSVDLTLPGRRLVNEA